MNSNLLEKGYESHDVEKRWYDYWQQQGLFDAGESDSRKYFSIVIPPPNVTGVLHMGHALNITLQDILCRYMRLRGHNVLWMPGTDHAGIATQNVVEKKLASEGRNRDQLGRENFVEEVWKWREESGSAIINQLKRLGASCDWKRERFTMDEGLSRAVRKVFVQLYQEGLIYRGSYIINWCPRCQTALSDLEVEHEELDGNLYYVRYPFPGNSEGLVIATTRPETLLGDTAVAVNPDDERYQNTASDQVILPLVNREIPIIRDTYVDMSFGTGALKITPAHDPNDFEIGMRHKLPSIKVIGEDGKMTADAGIYEGMDRFECRKAVIKALEDAGLLLKIEPIKHAVGHCYRCKTIVEPNLSTQWFVKVKPLAEKAIEAVQNGTTTIVPGMWANTYFDWMNNIKDWCISRQIWWGHQIPVWTCEDCQEVICSTETPTQCTRCGGTRLIQETDVLDTWFSSALWPFSTMGWPDQTQLLKKYYPTSVLVTGFDILFFWVARMMMMGIHFMGEVPFKTVYVHALVRDENGQKMSKSKGNVIDPLTIIDQYGTDAFRYTLAAFAAQGRDIKMSEQRVEGYRHFVNKLWNAARFSLMHIKTGFDRIDEQHISLPDRWILSRLHQVTDDVADALDTYRFNDAAGALYQFVWHELCDWYLEAIKPALYGNYGADCQHATTGALWHVLKDTLVLLHSFMPFVTEEIWQKLPGTQNSIMKAAFPSDGFECSGIRKDTEAETAMQLVMDIISSIRNIRGEMNISPSQLLRASVHASDNAVRNTIETYQSIIVHLARLESFSVVESGDRPKSAATSIIKGAVVFVPLEGIIDFGKETVRLEKELNKLNKELNSLSRKLINEDFLKKAPEEVVEKVKDQHKLLVEKQHKLEANLEKITGLQEE
ncbi:MAG: valine--tRNA ligase [Desulfobacterales bacterium]|nr:valine--tRNA ligase [Desulfobacterales bacterium]MDD4072635.1 valine--tRNA ligase [Desulfobacterales bacterium]MDD4391469.1 valine--tRNA ligase [Desulfobacterales bacterium]